MLTTILHRPYVFAFLISFLVLGRIYWGWRRTIVWLILGYFIAWASEVSSINNGFPYGLYHYIYENMQGEIMIAGVPFWDSLSYPFMIFAGYTTAGFALQKRGWKTILFGAFLTMLLDVIIDPLTVMGNRWFLGNIYFYPNGGQYFGVPITNFLGWFIVPLAVIVAFELIEKRIFLSSFAPPAIKPLSFAKVLNPLFYLSIALFNIIITIYIGEKFLAALDCLILMPIVRILHWRIKNRSRS